jgi:hypothetical protein
MRMYFWLSARAVVPAARMECPEMLVFGMCRSQRRNHERVGGPQPKCGVKMIGLNLKVHW